MFSSFAQILIVPTMAESVEIEFGLKRLPIPPPDQHLVPIGSLQLLAIGRVHRSEVVEEYSINSLRQLADLSSQLGK